MKTMATAYSHENKCATNYSIITNNNWNDANNMQLTKHDTRHIATALQRTCGVHALRLHAHLCSTA